jgi:hypothetical protein
VSGISYDVETEKLITGSITAVSQTVDLTGPNSGTDVVQVVGTWVGTLIVEGSNDGTNFVPLPLIQQSTGFIVSSISANDAYIVASNGYNQERVRASAWTSGTATITDYGSNYPSILYLFADRGYGTVGSNTPRSASQVGNATGAADFNAGATGAQTLRTVSNQGAPNTVANSWPAKITDGTNIASVSTHNDVGVADGLGSSGVYGNLALTSANTAYEAKVGGSRLAARKSLTITPIDATVYWGYSNTVTTNTGTPIFKNQFTEFCLDPTDSSVQIWLVCGSASKNVRITECP